MAWAIIGPKMTTKALNFALDEKGLKTLAPTLVGQTISYWDDDRLLRGLVTAADVARDRYGNPYIEVELEAVAA
jgi:hypothetical protein